MSATAIATVSLDSARALLLEGWEGDGSSYHLGSYGGDAEALGAALGRPATYEERCALERAVREHLDAYAAGEVPFEGRWEGPTTETDDSAIVILDPEDRSVSLWVGSRACCPEGVYHGRHVGITLPRGPIAREDVQAVLEGLDGTIRTLCALYEGPRFDGHNLVGAWSDDEARARLIQELGDALDEANLRRYSDAEGWLESGRDQVLGELRRRLIETGDLNAALDAQTERELDMACCEVLLDHEEVRDTLSAWAEQEGLTAESVQQDEDEDDA